MTEGKKDNIVEFPGGEESFAWKDKEGKSHLWYKGRYAIVKDLEDAEPILGATPHIGKYYITYLSPEILDKEDVILELEGQEKIEVREINSAKDYEAMQAECDRLNE